MGAAANSKNTVTKGSNGRLFIALFVITPPQENTSVYLTSFINVQSIQLNMVQIKN